MDRSYKQKRIKEARKKIQYIPLKAIKWEGAKYIVQRCLRQTEKL